MSELPFDAVLGYRSRSGLPAETWFLIIIAFVVIAILAWYFGAAQRLKRQLKQAKPWSLNELPEDTHGRVIGQARALGEELKGPLTGRRCVYYIAIVEEQRSTGRSSYWRTIASETRGIPFMLEDGTGRAIVDPNGAQVALDFDGNSKSGTFNQADPVQEQFLAKHGQKSEGWVFNKTLRYREAMIEVGETIAVLGSGIREPDPNAAPEAAYRGAPPTRLRLTSSPKFPLIISDDPATTRAT
jgi:cbb3-type cytochrome oxidase subunit 3